MSLVKHVGPIQSYATEEGGYRYSILVEFNCNLSSSDHVVQIRHNGTALSVDSEFIYNASTRIVGGPSAGSIPSTPNDEVVVVVESKWPPTLLTAIASKTALTPPDVTMGASNQSVDSTNATAESLPSAATYEASSQTSNSSPKKKSKKPK